MIPIHKLVAALVKRWDGETAAVVADWCEEHELVGAALKLREGPSLYCRAVIEALASCMALRAPVIDIGSIKGDGWSGRPFVRPEGLIGSIGPIGPAGPALEGVTGPIGRTGPVPPDAFIEPPDDWSRR